MHFKNNFVYDEILKAMPIQRVLLKDKSLLLYKKFKDDNPMFEFVADKVHRDRDMIDGLQNLSIDTATTCVELKMDDNIFFHCYVYYSNDDKSRVLFY